MLVDASFREGLGSTAYIGSLFGSWASTRRYQSSNEAEVAAVLDAMLTARDAAIPRMILATDCELAALVARPRRARAEGSWPEIARLMAHQPGWLLCYVRSETVKEAHSLAKRTLRHAHRMLWQAERAVERHIGATPYAIEAGVTVTGSASTK